MTIHYMSEVLLWFSNYRIMMYYASSAVAAILIYIGSSFIWKLYQQVTLAELPLTPAEAIAPTLMPLLPFDS